MIDPVLVDPHDLFFTWSPWSISISSCSISWVSLSREPAREYGDSVCPRGPGCSVSRVSLSKEPTQEYEASVCPRGPCCSVARVSMSKEPIQE